MIYFEFALYLMFLGWWAWRVRASWRSLPRPLSLNIDHAHIKPLYWLGITGVIAVRWGWRFYLAFA